MPFTAWNVHSIFEKERKRIYVFNHCLTWGKFSQANGQEGRGAENTIVLFYVVMLLHKSGEHSAETLHILWFTSAMKQWRWCRGFTYYELRMQWSNEGVAEALHIITILLQWSNNHAQTAPDHWNEYLNSV